MRRRRLWLALAAVTVLLLAVTGYWYAAARRLQAGFAAWVAQSRSQGWTVQAGPARIGGWPSAATLSVTGFRVSGGAADIPGGMDWGAHRVVLRVSLLDPRNLTIIAGGPQTVRLGTAPAIAYTSQHMQAVVPLQPGSHVPDVSVHAVRLRAAVAGIPGSKVAIGMLTGSLTGSADLHPAAARGQPALTFSLGARDTSLSLPGCCALGNDIAVMQVDAALQGPLPHTASPVQNAAAWRDAGGLVRVPRFGLAWGPLHVSGKATLKLDRHLQPAGTASARVTGYDATIDSLATQGALTRSAAVAAKALLSLVASTPSGAGSSDANPSPASAVQSLLGGAASDTAAADVPVTLHGGTLSVQAIPLLHVPPLDWAADQE